MTQPMTERLQGQLHTPEPSRILQRLCFHFQRKIAVRYDARQGVAHFPWGRCTLTAEEALLHFACEATDDAQLARVRHVIDEHIALFSRKQPLAVQWQSAPAA
ncbi:MAG: DUF2218 domain-containing protein [Pseudomonadota bacterium]|nr:DUF2218 domain-containing protein [Pseudomonadota bacterium]